MANCKVCGGTGLLPFKREDGSVVPYTFLHCSCNEINQPEHYRDIKPQDMDFPCSDSWRGYYMEQYSGHGPVTVTASREVVREVVVERQPANMLPIRSDLLNLRNKLNEHVDAAKKAAEARRHPVKQKTGYKGLEIKD